MQPQDEAVLARSHHKKAGLPPLLLPPDWTWSGGDNDLTLVHPPAGSLCEGSISDQAKIKRSRDGLGPSKYKNVTFDQIWQAKHAGYTATHFDDGGVNSEKNKPGGASLGISFFGTGFLPLARFFFPANGHRRRCVSDPTHLDLSLPLYLG